MKRLQKICSQYTLPQQFMAMGIYPYYTAIEAEQDRSVSIKGRKVPLFGSNSDLGRSNGERVKESAIAAT